MTQPENPFVFGEVIDDRNFVNRTEKLAQLVRDLADGQKSISAVSAALRKKLTGFASAT
jgi:hypothetical protein